MSRAPVRGGGFGCEQLFPESDTAEMDCLRLKYLRGAVGLASIRDVLLMEKDVEPWIYRPPVSGLEIRRPWRVLQDGLKTQRRIAARGGGGRAQDGAVPPGVRLDLGFFFRLFLGPFFLHGLCRFLLCLFLCVSTFAHDVISMIPV